ncbi:MAG: Smr/MutS family protein [Neomegalonema sp.]|nr:Smr/MutS family protein [Neomegalonema sp.]
MTKGGGSGKTTRGGKPISDEDLALWRRVVGSVTPFKKRASSDYSSPGPDEKPRSSNTLPAADARPTPAPPRSVRLEGAPRPPTVVPPRREAVQPLSQSTPGLDRRTAQRLRRGKIAPDARLDLHGMTMARAHRTLSAFVQSQFAAGSRCVLVITGKGGRSREPEPGQWREPEPGSGILKSQTPLWLSEPPLSTFVTGVYPAHISHGGGGALYVYLRKNPHSR